MTLENITTDDIEERFVAAHIALANAGAVLLDPVPSLAAASEIIADTNIAIANVIDELIVPFKAIRAAETTAATPPALVEEATADAPTLPLPEPVASATPPEPAPTASEFLSGPYEPPTPPRRATRKLR